LNDLLGQIAINLYAWFDYSMLHRKHWEHHNYTGQTGKDPDFHGGNMSVLAWFGRWAGTPAINNSVRSSRHTTCNLDIPLAYLPLAYHLGYTLDVPLTSTDH
jgi:fatty acid desaturase